MGQGMQSMVSLSGYGLCSTSARSHSLLAFDLGSLANNLVSIFEGGGTLVA